MTIELLTKDNESTSDNTKKISKFLIILPYAIVIISSIFEIIFLLVGNSQKLLLTLLEGGVVQNYYQYLFVIIVVSTNKVISIKLFAKFVFKTIFSKNDNIQYPSIFNNLSYIQCISVFLILNELFFFQFIIASTDHFLDYGLIFSVPIILVFYLFYQHHRINKILFFIISSLGIYFFYYFEFLLIYQTIVLSYILF